MSSLCMCGFSGESKLTVGVSVSVYSLSLCWPCDRLVSCPGCTLPLARAGIGSGRRSNRKKSLFKEVAENNRITTKRYLVITGKMKKKKK